MRIGIIGKVNEKNLNALVKRLNSILDYKVKLRKVDDIVGRVAVVTGVGFIPRIMQEAKDRGVNTYITGIITPNASEYSKKNYGKTLSEANKVGINIIGAPHYLTEKWTMLYSLPYFSEICKSEFVEDREALKVLE